MVVEKYAKELKEWLKPYFAEKKQELTTHRCSLTILSKEVRLLIINKTQDITEILLLETIPYDDIGNLNLVLTEIVKKYGLNNTPLYWLLQPEDYQLYLIESLPVPQSEFRDALSWRVRSLIPFPMEEAVMDYFMLPAKKSSPNHPMIGAVIAKSDQLKQVINILNVSGLSISIIDIPELAMRNLTSLYENDEKSTAFIYMTDKFTILNITRQKILYFTRRLFRPKINEVSRQDYEQLSLEILRYFDYFQSQWRYPTPTRIFIAAENENVPEIAKQLSELLAITVEPYTLKSILIDKQKLETIEKKYLLTLGCAIREEQNNAAPGN